VEQWNEICGPENAGQLSRLENAGLENAGQKPEDPEINHKQVS